MEGSKAGLLSFWWWWWLLFCTSLLNSGSHGDQGPEIPVPEISRVAFGSCANESSSQPIWNAIIEFDPQVFIWLGDNIYGDVRRPSSVFGKERTIGPWKNTPRFVPSPKQEMEAKYLKAKTKPGYSVLRKSSTIIGTWDDHDYGLNDAGKEFPDKITNQKLLLDFLDVPEESSRRKQEGVYVSYMFGPKGKMIQVILLDTRYHRDPLQSDGTILGHSQWSWLERELKEKKSEITIIASSIQVIANLSAITMPLFSMESWGRFPKERTRLFNLISESKRDGVFFISGDIHYGEISRHDCASSYPIYDITSSGLTQAIELAFPPYLTNTIRFLSWFTPSTMRVMGNNCRFRSCTYGQPNFGTIEINWTATPVTLKLEIRDVSGRPVAGVNVSLSELHWQNTTTIAGSHMSGSTKRHCTLESDLPWFVRYRLVILFDIFVSALVLAVVFLIYNAICISRSCLRKCKLE